MSMIDQMGQYIPTPRGDQGRFLSNAALAELGGQRLTSVAGIPAGVSGGVNNLLAPMARGSMAPTSLPAGVGWSPYQAATSSPRFFSGASPGASGGVSGLLGQMGFQNANRPITASWLPQRVANFANKAPGLSRGIGWGIAGNVAGGALESFMDDQGWGRAGDVLGSAARGAGLGAAFGLPGALVGGLGGAAVGFLRGDGGGEPELTVPERMDQLAEFVDPTQLARANALYEAFIAAGFGEEDAFNTAYGEIVANIGQTQTAPDVLALQMASQAMMQPIVDQARQRFATYQQMMDERIATLPPEYQAIYSTAVPDALFWQNQILDANMLAAQMAPVAEAIRQQQGSSSGYGSILSSDPLVQQALLGG